MFIVMSVGVFLVSGGLFWVILDRVWPMKCWLAQNSNVPRRHLESFLAWEKRAWAAYEVRSKASDAFLAAAKRDGSCEQDGRCMTFSLPSNHPDAIRYMASQFPDGPSLENLLELAAKPKTEIVSNPIHFDCIKQIASPRKVESDV